MTWALLVRLKTSQLKRRTLQRMRESSKDSCTTDLINATDCTWRGGERDFRENHSIFHARPPSKSIHKFPTSLSPHLLPSHEFCFCCTFAHYSHPHTHTSQLHWDNISYWTVEREEEKTWKIASHLLTIMIFRSLDDHRSCIYSILRCSARCVHKENEKFMKMLLALVVEIVKWRGNNQLRLVLNFHWICSSPWIFNKLPS